MCLHSEQIANGRAGEMYLPIVCRSDSVLYEGGQTGSVLVYRTSRLVQVVGTWEWPAGTDTLYKAVM